MKTTVLGVMAVVLTCLCFACSQKPDASAKPAGASSGDPELNTDDQKAMYALGLLLSQKVTVFRLTPDELELVKAGLGDAVLKRPPKVDLQANTPKLQQIAQARSLAAAEEEKKAGQAFLDRSAKAEGASKTESGLIYSEISAGTGPQPKATDKVKVHYHGTLVDGTVFDSSVQRGEPASFTLNQVIPCWAEGLQKMKVGGKSKLVCPSAIAYGDHGMPPKIKPGATLVFEVELLGIEQ